MLVSPEGSAITATQVVTFIFPLNNISIIYLRFNVRPGNLVIYLQYSD